MNNSVTLRISADTKEAQSALEALRRSQLKAFKETADSAKAAAAQWKASEEKVKSLAQAARSAGADQEKHSAAMKAAQAQAARAKSLWEQETQALHKRRAALAQNAAAIAQMQAQNAASLAQKQAPRTQVDNALSALGVRSASAIRAEIASINQAFSAMQRNSTFAVGDLQRAALARSAKIAELNRELSALPVSKGAGASGLLGGVGGFLSVTAVAAASRKFIEAADAIKLLEGRLKLATGSTAGMKVAMADVTRIANGTSQALEPVSTLYARLHKSVAAMGGSQKETADTTEAVALALKISGATAAESASAILQLSQAFASGVMRGEEFNSVNEAAPRLMQAIADGMKVPVGALRQMAADGKLTSEVLARVLPASLAKLKAEAAGLPDTAEQAWQRLENQLSLSAREIDKTTGATQKLAAAISVVTQQIDEAAKSDTLRGLLLPFQALGEALRLKDQVKEFVASIKTVAPAFKLLQSIDYNFVTAPFTNLARVTDFIGMTGTAVAATPDQIKKTTAALKELDSVISDADAQKLPELAQKLRALSAATIKTPGADLNQTAVDAQNYANAWITKHKALNVARETLGKLQLEKQKILAGQETLTAKEAIDKQVKELERLKSAREASLQKAIADLQKYRDAATAALQKESDLRTSTEDKLRELKRKGMSESAQQTDIELQAAEKLAAAAKKQEEARAAAARGDTGAAEKAAAEAEKLAEQAASLGERLNDTGAAIDLVGKAGALAADSARAVADANTTAASGAESTVAQLQASIAQVDKQLAALTQQEKAIKVSAQVDEALAAVEKLQKELDAIQSKEITVAIRTVEAKSTGGPVGFSRGGALPGYGGGDRIPAILEAGEVVLRKEAVRKYGLSNMLALNALRAPTPLPVRAVSALSLPSSRASGPSSDAGNTLHVRLSAPWGEQARVRSSRGEAEAMLRILRRAGIRFEAS